MNILLKLKTVYFLCLWFLIFNPLKSQNIKIIDQDGKVVTDVLLIKEHIYLGGVSDRNGLINYPISWENTKVNLHKLGYLDTSIILKNKTTYLIKFKNNKIKQVEIGLKRKNPAEKLKKFVDYNIPLMQSKRDTLFFDFEYTVIVPDKNWKELRTGVLKLVYNAYQKKSSGVWNSEYCNFKIITDSAFWHSPIRKNFVTAILIGVFEKDGMRRNHLLRTDFTKSWNKGKHSLFQENTNKGYQFEITSRNNVNQGMLFSEVGFNYDSTLSFYSFQWLNKTEKEVDAGLKKAKHNAHYSYVKYSNKQPYTIDSIYAKVGFISKNGYSHIIEFKAKQNLFNPDECIKNSFFLEFMPREFEKRKLQKNIYYR